MKLYQSESVRGDRQRSGAGGPLGLGQADENEEVEREWIFLTHWLVFICRCGVNVKSGLQPCTAGGD